MEDFITIIAIILFIFGVFQIILLAKIWGMTNDIKAIKNKYLGLESIESKDFVKQPIINIDLQTKLQVGSIVTNSKSGKQMKISKITNTGKYLCINIGSMFPEGEFDETEIELFRS